MNLRLTMIGIFLMLLSTTNFYGQNTSFGCYTDFLRSQELNDNPELQNEIDEILKFNNILKLHPVRAMGQHSNPARTQVL